MKCRSAEESRDKEGYNTRPQRQMQKQAMDEEEFDSKETDELKVIALPGPLATPLKKF